MQSTMFATVPSRFVHAERPEAKKNYRRVVGISTYAGHAAVGYELTAPQQTRQTETIQSPAWFAKNALSFFRTWMVDRNPEDSYNYWSNNANYLCHSFALNITGKAVVDAAGGKGHITRTADKLQPAADITEPLAFGTHAVIVDAKRNKPLHSSVAIGLDPDGRLNTINPTDHIQVFAEGGNIGIAPLADTVDYYTTRGYEPQVMTVPMPLLTQLRRTAGEYIAQFRS